MSIKIYIACGLTHVPRNLFEEYVYSIHALAKHLSAYSVKYALVNSDPQLSEIANQDKAKYCYLWDRKMIEEADLVIAEATFPSIGLGIELQLAESKNIPVIMVYSELNEHKAKPVTYMNPNAKSYALQIGEGFVSLMALGLPNILKVIPYNSIQTCIKDIQDEIDKYTRLTKALI